MIELFVMRCGDEEAPKGPAVSGRDGTRSSFSDPPGGCSFRGPGSGDARTKPISMIGTERQQTIQSHVSGVLALRKHLLVTNRPPNLPSLGAATRPRVRGHDHEPVGIETILVSGAAGRLDLSDHAIGCHVLCLGLEFRVAGPALP